MISIAQFLPVAAPVIDADGHVCEPPDLWTARLPPRLRDRGIRLRWNDDSGFDEAWVEDWCITDRGLVGLGNAGTPFVDLGRGRRYADGNPAGFDPRARLAALDAEGIAAAVLYPGLGLSLPAIGDAELAVASCRVYNDWIAGFCATDPCRLFGVAALPLQDPAAAVAEARRAVRELGLRGVFCRPNPLNGMLRQLHDDAFEPVWTALETLDIPAAGTRPTAHVNVSTPGVALAGFQVSIIGRILVSTEAAGTSSPSCATPSS